MWWPFCCWQQYSLRYSDMVLSLLGSLPWDFSGSQFSWTVPDSCAFWTSLGAASGSVSSATWYWCNWSSHAEDGQTLICNREILKDPGKGKGWGLPLTQLVWMLKTQIESESSQNPFSIFLLPYPWLHLSHGCKCWLSFLPKYSFYSNKTWIALNCWSELRL